MLNKTLQQPSHTPSPQVASGEGVEDAEVTIGAGLVNTLSPVSAVTDADGRYVVPHVSPGPIVLFGALGAMMAATSRADDKEQRSEP